MAPSLPGHGKGFEFHPKYSIRDSLEEIGKEGNIIRLLQKEHYVQFSHS